MTEPHNEAQKRLEEFQHTLQQLYDDTPAKHRSMSAPDTGSPFQHDLSLALSRRHRQMGEALQRAGELRQDDNTAARRAVLEQAQQQWNWFEWIIENQSKPPSDESQKCPACRLRRQDRTTELCASCYDNRIMYSTIG